ncbi:MAG: hypothetical protein ACTSQI_02745 [Candidatus Helarchaeota archaeon]
MENDPYIHSIKADIVPAINAELQIEPHRLFSLTIEALNELFGVLQMKTISVEKLRAIVLNNSDSNAVIQAIKQNAQSQSSIDIPMDSSPTRVSSNSGDLFGQDSIKTDIIPVIQNMINISSEKLFSLSVDTLNEIFGYLESGVIPASEIESIILSTENSNEISSKLQAKISIATSPSDTLKEDLITGILFQMPDIIREKIEPKLREISDINELTELSQMDLPEIQSRLGLELPAPQRYDERLDLIAGIVAQLPPSLRGVISDRLQEITDVDRLSRIANMNYVEVQRELGLAAQSPAAIPAEYLNPVDTASRAEYRNVSSSNASPDSTGGDSAAQEHRPSPRVQEMLRKRREENEKHVQMISKMAEKVWKLKLSNNQAQSPEATMLKERLEIIYRIHPDRVVKIEAQLKRVKDRKRFKALFYWYIFSQRIEEIETYVEHWQGQIQGIGGFRAAINVSRFDPIVEHMPTKEIEGLIVQARKALERVHSENINVRARGVEDIKQISNYLLQKMR